MGVCLPRGQQRCGNNSPVGFIILQLVQSRIVLSEGLFHFGPHVLNGVDIRAVSRVRLHLDTVFFQPVLGNLGRMDARVILKKKGPRSVVRKKALV